MTTNSESLILFSESPLEIRRQIWTCAMELRVVRANYPMQMRRSGRKNNPFGLGQSYEVTFFSYVVGMVFEKLPTLGFYIVWE
jgi:hypothetical protein